MELYLDAVSSCPVKKKSLCANLQWLGKEKEGLFCLNKDEIATLTLPTGKTKKKKKNFAAFYKSENLALSTFAQDPDENCEVCVDVGYFVTSTFGPCVLVSYCFYHEGRLLVATNLSRWNCWPLRRWQPHLASSFQAGLAPAILPIYSAPKPPLEHVRGSLLVRFCPNQPLLAVCVNQRSAEAACLVYVTCCLAAPRTRRNRAGGNGTGGPGGGAGRVGQRRQRQPAAVATFNFLRDIGLYPTRMSWEEVAAGQAGSRGAPATWVRDLAWDCRGLFLVALH
uniref:CNH domain-containing protein n=1 Tax=Macrostomum lignano TaxID=282301 RepID=A0A1I8I7D4_9PLAT